MHAAFPATVRVAVAYCLGGLFLLAACAPDVERSGLGDVAVDPPQAVGAQWATITDDPAIESLTVRGAVVVQAAEQVASPGLARVLDLPLGQGDPVSVGDVVAVLQPTSPEVEAFDSAAQALAAATAAANGPAATRPSPEQVEALVTARDQAAAAMLTAESVASEAIEVLATSAGVVVAVDVTLGELVDEGDLLAAVGPVSSVEVHVRVDDADLDVFTEFADQAVLVEQTVDAVPQAVTLAPQATRVVATEEGRTVMRMVFTDLPRVTEGQRVDVELSIEPALDARSVPVDAVRVLDNEAFVLLDDPETASGLRRVAVSVTRVGPELAEIRGDVELGHRVLLR